MNFAVFVAVLAAAVLVGVAIYVRLTPVDSGAVPRPDAKPVGDYPAMGGHYAVRAVGDVDLDRIKDVIARTKRTKAVDAEAGIYMHRSGVFAFPDITHVWIEDGAVHLYSHLIYGKSDLSANRKRIGGWLQELGIR